jgi:hypothetical protein
MFFYSDNEPRQNSAVPYHKQNATKSYLTHYDNLLFLQFVIRNSDDQAERAQAIKEQEICQRKMKHWTHHANYDQKEAIRGIERLKKQWS